MYNQSVKCNGDYFNFKRFGDFVNLLLYSSFPAKLHGKDRMTVEIAGMSNSFFSCKKLKTLLLHPPLPPLYCLAFARDSNGKLNDKINKIMEEPLAGLCVDAARVADQPQSMTKPLTTK